MPEQTPDFNKMIEEEVEKLGGPTKEGEAPITGIKEPTLEEKLANRRAREESEAADEQALEKVRTELSAPEKPTETGPAKGAVEVVESERLPSDVKAAKDEVEPFEEENAELLKRAKEMKKSSEAGKKIDDSAQAELFRDIAEQVFKERGEGLLPAVEKLAGRYKGRDEHLTAMDKAMKVVESFYPEFRKMMGDEAARSPENMVSRMKKILGSRFDGLAGTTAREGAAKETASGKLAGDILMDFQSRLKGGEAVDPKEYNAAFDSLARKMIGEKFKDLGEEATKQLMIDLGVKRAKLFNSLASMRDLKPETAANFQRMIDEDIKKMSLPRQPKDFGRIEKSSEGKVRKFFRRLFGG
jgi:hypothetical protein